MVERHAMTFCFSSIVSRFKMSDSGGTESKEAIPLEDIALMNEESHEKIPPLNDEDKHTDEVTKKEKRLN